MLAFYPSLLVDEVDDSIGVDDTVQRADDDISALPQDPVIQAPIVPPTRDQTNSPTLSLSSSSKEEDSPVSSNSSLLGGSELSSDPSLHLNVMSGVIFAAVAGIIFFVAKGSLTMTNRRRSSSPSHLLLTLRCTVILLFRIMKIDNKMRSTFR
jgi:hypothetical protein